LFSSVEILVSHLFLSGTRDSSEPIMQIRMNTSADRIAELPDWTAPSGYLLRGVEPGDEDRLPELLSAAGIEEWVGNFDAAGMRDYLDIPDRSRGSFVIRHKSDIVACCFATRRGEFCPAWGILDYVCVHPDHRRKALGFGVCAAVLRYFRTAGYRAVTLTTLGISETNHRIKAVALYLKLGLVPVRTEENSSLCEDIYREIGRPLPVQWWQGVTPFSCNCMET
jgi:GNAT superfamily N-acetyltransferase